MKKIYSFFKQKDKQMHLAVCLTASLIHPMFAIWCAITKEYCDRKMPGNHWCWMDLLADAIGILIGTIIRGYWMILI